MSVRKEIMQILEETGIYHNLREKKGDVFFKPWYYITTDILKYLKYWIPIKITSHDMSIFRSFTEETRQTIRNKIQNWTYIYLKEGYYNKKEFIEYIIMRL